MGDLPRLELGGRYDGNDGQDKPCVFPDISQAHSPHKIALSFTHTHTHTHKSSQSRGARTGPCGCPRAAGPGRRQGLCVSGGAGAGQAGRGSGTLRCTWLMGGDGGRGTFGVELDVGHGGEAHACSAALASSAPQSLLRRSVYRPSAAPADAVGAERVGAPRSKGAARRSTDPCKAAHRQSRHQRRPRQASSATLRGPRRASANARVRESARACVCGCAHARSRAPTAKCVTRALSPTSRHPMSLRLRPSDDTNHVLALLALVKRQVF